MCLYYSNNLKKELANIDKLSNKKSMVIISSPVPTLKTVNYFDNTHIYPPNIFFSENILIKLMNNKKFNLIKSKYSKKIYNKNLKSYSQNFILIFKKNSS